MRNLLGKQADVTEYHGRPSHPYLDPMTARSTLLVLLLVLTLTGHLLARSPSGRRCPIEFLDDLFGRNVNHQERNPFTERIETDRHDFTQSTKTVGRGVVQIEAGYTTFYKDFRQVIEQSHTGPELLTRLGLSEDIEFRIRWNYVWQVSDEEPSVSGAEDLRWAFKLRVTDPNGWLPASAIELRFTAPTGGQPYNTERVQVGVDYIYSWRLVDSWQLSGSSGFGTNGLGEFGLLPLDPSSDRFIVWSQSVALGCELTERSTFYSEVFGLFSSGLPDNYAFSVFNVGIDYYLSWNMVVDVRAGVGLTGEADDSFLGIGGAYRF